MSSFEGGRRSGISREASAILHRTFNETVPTFQRGRHYEAECAQCVQRNRYGNSEGMAVATVKVDIGGGNVVTSVVTVAAVKDLGIKIGDEINVLVKATSVMPAKD